MAGMLTGLLALSWQEPVEERSDSPPLPPLRHQAERSRLGAPTDQNFIKELAFLQEHAVVTTSVLKKRKRADSREGDKSRIRPAHPISSATDDNVRGWSVAKVESFKSAEIIQLQQRHLWCMNIVQLRCINRKYIHLLGKNAILTRMRMWSTSQIKAALHKDLFHSRDMKRFVKHLLPNELLAVWGSMSNTLRLGAIQHLNTRQLQCLANSEALMQSELEAVRHHHTTDTQIELLPYLDPDQVMANIRANPSVLTGLTDQLLETLIDYEYADALCQPSLCRHYYFREEHFARLIPEVKDATLLAKIVDSKLACVAERNLTEDQRKLIRGAVDSQNLRTVPASHLARRLNQLPMIAIAVSMKDVGLWRTIGKQLMRFTTANLAELNQSIIDMAFEILPAYTALQLLTEDNAAQTLQGPQILLNTINPVADDVLDVELENMSPEEAAVWMDSVTDRTPLLRRISTLSDSCRRVVYQLLTTYDEVKRALRPLLSGPRDELMLLWRNLPPNLSQQLGRRLASWFRNGGRSRARNIATNFYKWRFERISLSLKVTLYDAETSTDAEWQTLQTAIADHRSRLIKLLTASKEVRGKLIVLGQSHPGLNTGRLIDLMHPSQADIVAMTKEMATLSQSFESKECAAGRARGQENERAAFEDCDLHAAFGDGDIWSDPTYVESVRAQLTAAAIEIDKHPRFSWEDVVRASHDPSFQDKVTDSASFSEFVGEHIARERDLLPALDDLCIADPELEDAEISRKELFACLYWDEDPGDAAELVDIVRTYLNAE